MFRISIPEGLRGLRRCLLLWWLAVVATVLSLLVALTVLLLGSGLGLLMLPRTVGYVRKLADRQRELVGDWTGEPVPVPYDPLPDPLPKGLPGVAARCQWIVRDRQTWRDWAWIAVEPIVGAAIASGPLLLVLGGIWGLAMPFYGVELSQHWDGLWFEFIPVRGQFTAALAGALGAVNLGLALWGAPHSARIHAAYTRSLLAPGPVARMAHRIEHLSATRSDAVDTQMAEICRIERDLHDGAQARLVAMGMTLDAAGHLLESNPEAVRQLLLEARESSSKALEELRDLVRGIHPPVLADRGLPDAIRALALVSPLRTEVNIDLPGRAEPPVESALYFAVSEAIANAAKHAHADRLWIDVRYDQGKLRVTVTDDGQGGARIGLGTGLRGIERRLATFDGALSVRSPHSGPTMVTMELPCVLSSPKTTSCSGTV
ncbi:sensor histidine kinase [Streptomyces blastmyceticus]|uniref:histidine kinase n=1 Tax=Streptomyces blastmyceticus TaxID=68180 RepID=A0ABP3G592_9ACTN